MIGLSNGPDVAKVSTVVSSAVYDSVNGLVLSGKTRSDTGEHRGTSELPPNLFRSDEISSNIDETLRGFNSSIVSAYLT